MITLSAAVKHEALPNVRRFNVINFDIGDEGAVVFANMIASTTRFTSMNVMQKLYRLKFHNAGVGDVGIKAISSSILGGAIPQLQFLLLGNNHITTTGMDSILDIVQRFALQTSTFIYLKKNALDMCNHSHVEYMYTFQNACKNHYVNVKM